MIDFHAADFHATDLHAIDLHTHTWYSDGTLSPAQLVKMAKEKGIETLAITDHDGTYGLAEGKAAAEKYGIRFICGLEFSAVLSGPVSVYMHILGYGFDPENGPLRKRIDEIREQRKTRNEAMRRALEELGYPLSAEDLEVYPGQDYIGKPNFARALAVRGYAADIQEAFASDRMMASPAVKAVHREKIEAAQAIELIRGAGGFAALAHPYKISYAGKWNDEPEVFLRKLEGTVSELTRLGMEGMECCYSSHSPEQERELLALAEKYQLKVTAGSDYHGPGIKKNVELGGIHGS